MLFEAPTKILLHMHRAGGIARRYLVTNGFDGALTMLGMMAGFYSRDSFIDPAVALSASLGAAIALFMSGLSSAYLSESAERRKELKELEQALISDLETSDYGHASRYLPIVIALVNGFSPLLISLLILSPLWLSLTDLTLPASPYLLAMIIALACTFLLGIFLGSISRTHWLWAGFRSLLIAMLTISIIMLFDTFFNV